MGCRINGAGWRLALPALLSAAAADTICSSPTLVTDLQQTASFAGCSTFSGSLTISAEQSRPTFDPQSGEPLIHVNLPFVQVDGSLEVSGIHNAYVSGSPIAFAVDFSNLQTVNNDLRFTDLPLAGLPYLPSLANVGGSLSYIDLVFNGAPANHTSALFRNMTFSGCQRLPALQISLTPGVDMDPPPSADVIIVGNPGLSSLNMSGHLTNQVNLRIADNGPDFTLVTNVVNGSLSIADVSSFNAPLLRYLVAGDVEGVGDSLIVNNSFGTFELQSLESIAGGGAFSIADNSELISVDMPSLSDISALSIVDNIRLGEIDLSNLAVVDELEIGGPFTSIALPTAATVSVVGAVRLRPTQQSICTSITAFGDSGLCGTSVQLFTSSTALANSPTSTPEVTALPNHSGSGLSSGAKIGLGVGVGIGGLLLLIGGVVLVLRRRRRNGRNPRSAGANEYSMVDRNGTEHTPMQYMKVPATSEVTEDSRPYSRGGQDTYNHSSDRDQRPVSAVLADDRLDRGQDIPIPQGRVELEEQQGMRHEMDARSLPPDRDDIDDNEEETRSLQDIERVHNQSRQE